MRYLVLLLLLGLAAPAYATDAGRFQTLHIYPPAGTPSGLAFVLSDMSGWSSETEAAAKSMQKDGWLAVGLDLAKYRDGLRNSDDTCHDVGDELIDLSQHLQRERGISTYLTPVLIGYGQGGVLAYAALKQALPASFTAGIAIGETKRLDLPKTLCDGPPAQRVKAGGYKYDLTAVSKAPFTHAAQASADELPGMFARYRKVVSQNTIADLPLVPLEPLAGSPANTSDTFVIFLSGDGGWRDIDKTLANVLHNRGYGVVGWDSLRYFWSRKTPERLASDLGRVIAHYSLAWNKPRVVLVGYSFGADALPFAYNRLPATLQLQVRRLQLLSLGKDAAFEIEVEGYIGLSGQDDAPLSPELARVQPDKLLCVVGQDDADDSACPTLARSAAAQVFTLPGDHHFDEDYETVARIILKDLARP